MLGTNGKQGRDEERGGIMVLGLMLGAFTVAALFYLIDVGYASIWREATQDAADATAFEAAVWEARGMNVIAALNIFIAVVMMVLMAWRMVLFSIGLLTVVAGIACFVPGLQGICPAAGWLGRATVQMGQKDKNVQKAVYNIIKVLHSGQRVVASVLPVLSVVRPSVSVIGRPHVTAGIALGSYAIPAVALNALVNGSTPDLAITPRGARKTGASKSDKPGQGKPGAQEPGGEKPSPGVDPSKPKPGGQPNNPGTDAPGTQKPGTKPGDTDEDPGSTHPARPESCPLVQKPPSEPEQPDGAQADKKPRKRRKPLDAGDLLGIPLSLPMEASNDVDLLCAKSGKMMGDNVTYAAEILLRQLLGAAGSGDSQDKQKVQGGGSSALGTALEYVSDGMGDLLCGSLDSAAGKAQEFLDAQVKEVCGDPTRLAEYEKTKKEGESSGEACERETRAQAEAGPSADPAKPDAQSGDGKPTATKPTPGGAAPQAGKLPELQFAQTWGALANGNMFGQSWSVVRATAEHSTIDQLIGIAASFESTTTTVSEIDEGITLFAQSEMFFDCEDDWDSCYPNSAWQLNWRARMRRVRSPLDLAASNLENSVLGVFNQLFSQPPVQRAMGALPLLDLFSQASGSLVPDQLRTATEELRGQVAQQGGDAARWVVEQGLERASFIH